MNASLDAIRDRTADVVLVAGLLVAGLGAAGLIRNSLATAPATETQPILAQAAHPAAEPSVTPVSVATPAAAPVPVAAATEVELPAPEAATTESARISYPDGSTMPMLNGIDEAVTIRWPTDVPFAPVEEKVTSNGQEWYRHEDGSWTTVVKVKDLATGRELVMPQVWNPGPVAQTTLRASR